MSAQLRYRFPTLHSCGSVKEMEEGSVKEIEEGSETSCTTTRADTTSTVECSDAPPLNGSSNEKEAGAKV